MWGRWPVATVGSGRTGAGRGRSSGTASASAGLHGLGRRVGGPVVHRDLRTGRPDHDSGAAAAVARLDLVAPAGDVDAYIANRAGSFSCHRPAGEPWSCQADSQPPPGAGALSLDDGAGAVNSLTQSATAYSMAVEPRRIAGVNGRCLIAIPKARGSGRPETLCIAPTGVPLLIESGGAAAVRATKYRPSASGNAFKL